jgi:hypothetical protein
MGETPKVDVVEEEVVRYCPLAMVQKEDGTHLPCGREACGWWSKAEEACAVEVLAKIRPSGWWAD